MKTKFYEVPGKILSSTSEKPSSSNICECIEKIDKCRQLLQNLTTFSEMDKEALLEINNILFEVRNGMQSEVQ